jgi:putative transposase
MKQIITVSCQLKPDNLIESELNNTLEVFANACNWINQNIEPKIFNKNKIQKECYYRLRDNFKLSSNLSIRAIARVASNRKSADKDKSQVSKFKATSIDYDSRIFSFNQKDWLISLTLLNGRFKIPLDIGDYQKKLLADSKPSSATLIKKNNGKYFIQIQVKVNIPEMKQTEKIIGVDLGRIDIIHTSEGLSYSGDIITKIRDKYSMLRASLQKKASKGTRSSRRRIRELLKQLSGKEKRFQSAVNHKISKDLVSQAKQKDLVIAIEDLTGIRKSVNSKARTKEERRRSNRWSFYQLRTFIEYKANIAGVNVIAVNPAWTSQTCHNCFHLGKRSGKHFSCDNCGLSCDADFNGSKNIKILGAVVNQPGGSGPYCRLQGY